MTRYMIGDETMKKRAVLYARVSGDDRGNDGRNLIGQLGICREYAKQQGYSTVAELAEDDRGASGAEIDLPQLDRARKMAAAGEFDVLIVRELDRLSRNMVKQLIVEDELKRTGVTIEYAIGAYPDTPEGNLMKHVRATVAEYEREKITERMTRGRRLKVQTGNVVVHGRPPYGYRLANVDGKRALVIHEAEARIVRLIFVWYTQGDGDKGPLSIYAIAKRLTELRVPSRADNDPKIAKQSEYGRWNRTTVRNILRRESYAGIWHYGKVAQNGTRRVYNPREKWIPLEVPAVVTREVWDSAQKQMEKNRCDSRRNLKHQYLLRRRLTCGTCGVKMNAQTTSPTKGGYAYYFCPAHLRLDNYARECSQGQYFRVDHVDAAVWRWIRSLLAYPEQLAEGLKAEQSERHEMNKPLTDRLAVIDRLLADNLQQLDRLLKLYLTGEFSEAILVEHRNRLEKTVDGLQKERGRLVAQVERQELTDEQIANIVSFAEKVAQGLDKADQDFDARRRLIELLDVRTTLSVEDGEKIAYVHCMVDEAVLPIAITNTGRCCGRASCQSSPSKACPRSLGVPATLPGPARPGTDRQPRLLSARRPTSRPGGAWWGDVQTPPVRSDRGPSPCLARQ